MTAPSAELRGAALHPGSSAGAVLRLQAPLSFWGGVADDGRIIDAHHPQHGESVTGRVLAMPSGRGSSSSSSVLAELLRTGSGPSAIVMAESDAIIALGAIVAHELYATSTPVVVLAGTDFQRLPYCGHVVVEAGTAAAAVRFA